MIVGHRGMKGRKTEKEENWGKEEKRKEKHVREITGKKGREKGRKKEETGEDKEKKKSR